MILVGMGNDDPIDSATASFVQSYDIGQNAKFNQVFGSGGGVLAKIEILSIAGYQGHSKIKEDPCVFGPDLHTGAADFFSAAMDFKVQGNWAL